MYAIFFNWPSDGSLELVHAFPTRDAQITLLGNGDAPLQWTYSNELFSSMHNLNCNFVVVLPPLTIQIASQPVWAVKMLGVL